MDRRIRVTETRVVLEGVKTLFKKRRPFRGVGPEMLSPGGIAIIMCNPLRYFVSQKETPLSGRRAEDAISGGVSKVNYAHRSASCQWRHKFFWRIQPMTRVIAYVDGFNLYFGLKSKGWKRHYWLDLNRLATLLLKPYQTLTTTHYFTSRIRDDGHNIVDMQRQTTYLEALATLQGLQIHALLGVRSRRKPSRAQMPAL